MTAVVLGQMATNAFLSTKGFKKSVTGIIEAQATLFAARAKKSREVCDYYGSMKRAKANGWRLDPPDYALDMHTGQGKRLNRSFRHFGEEGRRVSGDPPERNDYELGRWGQRAVPATDPDVEIPNVEKAMEELRPREKREFPDIPSAE